MGATPPARYAVRHGEGGSVPWQIPCHTLPPGGSLPSHLSLREGCAASRAGPRPEARRFPLSATPQQGGKRSWEYARCIPPFSLVTGQDWELRGHPGSEMLDGQSRGHSRRLARIPRRVPDCGPGAVLGAGARSNARTGTRASPRSAHFGDGTQGSAEHGLSILVERVSLVAGRGRRRQGPVAGHAPHQLL